MGARFANVVDTGALDPGASVTIAHGIKTARNIPVIPNIVLPDKATAIAVAFVDAEVVVFENRGFVSDSSSFYVEIEFSTQRDPDDEPVVLYWQGLGENLSSGGAVIYWSSQSWSDIVDQINATPATDGVFVLIAPGTYTMDVPANLDRVVFIGMGAPPSESAGPVPVTVNVVDPFRLLGNFLYIDNVAMFVDTEIWSGGGRLQLRLEGSSFLSPLNGSSTTAIALPDNGIMDVAIGELSLLAGNSAPVPFVHLGQDSTMNILCTGSGIVGDFTAALAGGALSANANSTVDGTCVVSGSAFGAGIVTQIFPNGTPAFMPYTPTTPADWHVPIPTNVQEALDQAAARLTLGGL